MIRQKLKQQKGSSIVEFALVIPVLLFLIMMIFEISFIVLAQMILENGTSQASRFGITGATPDNTTREAHIRSIVESELISPMHADNLNMEVLSYSEFDNIGLPEPYIDANDNGQHDDGESFEDVNENGIWDSDMGRSSAGGAGEIVVYRFTYDYQPITPFIGKLLQSGNDLQITSNVVMMNEPF